MPFPSASLLHYLLNGVVDHAMMPFDLDPQTSRFPEKLREEVVERHEKLFQSFVGDVPGMQATMRRTRSVIAGSLALAFFSPMEYTPGTVDIFVPRGSYQVMRDYLIDRENYVQGLTAFNENLTTTPSNAREKPTFLEYGAGLQRACQLLRGDIVVSLFGVATEEGTNTVVEALTFSWTTLLMNFVTADGACCAYPRLTLRGRGLFHYARCAHGSHPFDMPINKYSGRGFDLAQHPSTWFDSARRRCERDENCPFTVRAFHDGGCLWVTKNTAEVALWGSSWVFGGVRERVHFV